MQSKLLHTLWSFTVMTLMIIGLGGLVYNTLRGGGWLQQFAGEVWDAGLRKPYVIIPLVAVSLWLVWLAFRGKLAGGKSHRGADLMVMALAAIGVYVIYDWLRG